MTNHIRRYALHDQDPTFNGNLFLCDSCYDEDFADDPEVVWESDLSAAEREVRDCDHCENTQDDLDLGPFETLLARDLEQLPTLAVGHTADLKVDRGGTRVWLSRTGLADGEPFENTVSVEQWTGESWETVREFDGGRA